MPTKKSESVAGTIDARKYQSNSVDDLLEAVGAYHVHLAHFPNVVGVAVGLFRYREGEPGNDPHDAKTLGQVHVPSAKRMSLPPRTLLNSQVRPWSPPSVLVFVNDWQSMGNLLARQELLIPPFLYLPNNRVIPTCVVMMQKQDEVSLTSPMLNFPNALVGGGYAVVSDVQGRTHVGSIGCLVSNGDQTFALTNRHVTGEHTGRDICTLVNGQQIKIGKSSGRSLGRVAFDKLYPDWLNNKALCSMDAGLILIDDVKCWTTQVYGVGRLGLPKDINQDELSFDMIGKPVKAFGGASGSMEGEVVAMFYRYRSLSGFDYIADVVIGPKDSNEPLPTHPGDSGVLWVLDEPDPRSGKEDPTGEYFNRPLALQWGGQVLLDAGNQKSSPFVLATFVSNICSQLDVDIVRDWNLGHELYWGEMGHYTIGQKACNILGNVGIGKLMSKNATNVGFDDSALSDKSKYKIRSAKYKAVPLADVADDVWRITRQTAGHSDENNHFADMDRPGNGKFKGKTLMDLFKQDPASVDPQVWQDYYDSINEDRPGALPFRVWQMFDLMIEAAKNKKVDEFVCLAGCMAHYVGDACQPLHISQFHHGLPDKQSTFQHKVHGAYETDMLDSNAADVVKAINAALSGVKVEANSKIDSGQQAAVAVVELMQRTIARIDPSVLVNFYNDIMPQNSAPSKLWAKFKTPTVANMADGISTLAILWASAWEAGNGNAVSDAQLVAFDLGTKLKPLYSNPDFAPSMPLADMIAVLKKPTGPVTLTTGGGGSGSKGRKRTGTGKRKQTAPRKAARRPAAARSPRPKKSAKRSPAKR